MLFFRFGCLICLLFDRPSPSLQGTVLTSDLFSPVPHLISLLLRIMDDIFSYHSINLEVAGVSSGKFVRSPDKSQGIICMPNQNKYSQCQAIHTVNGIK